MEELKERRPEEMGSDSEEEIQDWEVRNTRVLDRFKDLSTSYAQSIQKALELRQKVKTH